MTKDKNLPTWLVPQTLNPKQAKLELLHTTYANMFEVVLVKLSSGIPLKEILRSDFRELEYEHLLRWVHKDEERKGRYHEAQELGTEMLASEILDIADAVGSLEDVQRSKLRIETRKFIMGAWNKKRYGELKQVEQSVVIDISAAMMAAQNRVEDRGMIIDG